MWSFSIDGEETTDSWASLTPNIPPLYSFSVCLWFEIFHYRTYSDVVSLAKNVLEDDNILIGEYFLVYAGPTCVSSGLSEASDVSSLKALLLFALDKLLKSPVKLLAKEFFIR